MPFTSHGWDAEAEGLLAPFEIAVRRAQDGRTGTGEQNRISWWKFNSKALQFEMEPGQTYDFQVAGWLGMPNIVTAEPTSSGVECRCAETEKKPVQ